MSFCLHGVWEDVIIDDKIPCHKLALEPLFCKTKNFEMWGLLMEKAWAKVHGGYMNIEAGTLEEAMQALTGAPVHHFLIKPDQNKAEENWSVLKKAFQSGYALACSTKDFKERQCNERGLDTISGLV